MTTSSPQRGFLFALLLLASSAFAQSHSIDVGHAKLSISPPPGLVNMSTPEVLQAMSIMVSPAHRLVSVFLEPADVEAIAHGRDPKMERYFLLQIPRAIEYQTFSKAYFARVRQALGGDLQDRQLSLDRGLRIGLREVLGEPSLKVKNTQYHGAFHDTEHVQSQLVSSEYQAGASHERIAYSVTFALLKGKMVYAYGYTPHREAKDAEWLKQTVISWGDRLAAENLATPTR
jgi:hypothetical protein